VNSIYPSDDLISIITPSYNSEQFIAKTIDSVINQSHQNWEMIIIDDLSTDNSCEIIENYKATDPRIKLIKSKINQGPAYSRNSGIELAKGRYIAFLDSDDLWKPEKLKHQLEAFKETGTAISFSAYEWINENGNPLNKTIFVKKNINYSDMLNYNHIGCLTAIYDTHQTGKVYFKKIGHEDYIMWLSIIKLGHSATGINNVLAQYRIRTGSVSSNKLKMTKYQWHIYRKIENLGLIKSMYHFMKYTYNGVKKTFFL